MALPKEKPKADIALVFGGAPKKKPGMGGGDGRRPGRLLQAANPDVFTDEVLDALHEYVKDCMDQGEPDADDSDSMDMEGE